MRLTAFALAIALYAAPCAALSLQQTSTTPSKNDQNSDVVVNGLPLLNGKPPVEVRHPPDTSAGIKWLSEQSQQFVRCAQHISMNQLREVIDADPATPHAAAALDRLLRSNAACVQGMPMLPINLGDCNPRIVSYNKTECKSFYDRGVLLDTAIRRYAPDLQLTTNDTSDPAVQARFNAREVPRNRFRRDPDKLYFEVAVCMVREQPSLAVELVQSPFGGKDQSTYEDTLINRTRSCIGYAKEAKVDPTQFRIYITDAVYRWEVAARDVDTLIRYRNRHR